MPSFIEKHVLAFDEFVTGTIPTALLVNARLLFDEEHFLIFSAFVLGTFISAILAFNLYETLEPPKRFVIVQIVIITDVVMLGSMLDGKGRTYHSAKGTCPASIAITKIIEVTWIVEGIVGGTIAFTAYNQRCLYHHNHGLLKI
jgi:hypothetical protein